jgi:hypothetical protein
MNKLVAGPDSSANPQSAKKLFCPKWQLLSDMSSTPEWLKWHKTLQWFSLAIVTSLMIIS